MLGSVTFLYLQCSHRLRTGPERTSIAREAIATEAYNRAGTASQGWCARYVRRAVEAALGVTLTRASSATNYGPSYIGAGFSVVKTYGSSEDVDEGKLSSVT